MKNQLISCAIFIVTFNAVFSNPVAKDKAQSKFFFDPFPKGVMISRVTNDEQTSTQTTNSGYSIRFVPLITLLAGMFPNFMTKLGQFSGINKLVNTMNRRFDIADPIRENATMAPIVEEAEEFNQDDDDDEDDDEGEIELIECDGAHLGLWPDRSDSQRYYKCEVDPRTPPNANCIKDFVQGKHMDKTDMVPLEKIEVPGVKPCFLLSMMKCANGFKYYHKTRICVPDIVFGSQLKR